MARFSRMMILVPLPWLMAFAWIASGGMTWAADRPIVIQGGTGRRPDRRAEAAQPAVGRGYCGVLPGRRQDRQGRAGGKLRLGERGLAAGQGRRLARAARVVLSAQGVERQPAAAEGASR